MADETERGTDDWLDTPAGQDARAAGLRFAPLRPSEAEALHEIVSIWQVCRQLGSWPWPPDLEFTRARCAPFTGEGFIRGIWREGRLLGTIGVSEGNLGYQLHPDVQGQGIGTLAARAAVAGAWRTSARAEIKASVWHDNPASHAILTRLGFRLVETRLQPSLARGEETLCHHLCLARPEPAV